MQQLGQFVLMSCNIERITTKIGIAKSGDLTFAFPGLCVSVSCPIQNMNKVFCPFCFYQLGF